MLQALYLQIRYGKLIIVINEERDYFMKKTSLLAIGAAALGIAAVPTAAHAATVNITSGDTLWSVAQQHNTSVDQLEQLNNNVNPYALQVGMQLQVPDNNNQSTTQNNVKSIIVKSGDTLSGLAQQYNTTVSDLMSINHLTSDVIYVGQVLQLQQVVNNTQNAVKDTQQQVTVKQQQNNYSVNNNNNSVANTNNNAAAPATTSSSLSNNAAANAIAQAESGGSYTAQNGRYYGKYQLDVSYLHGDLSPANQDRVFQQYCNQRYGSIANALAFRQAHGWY